MTIITGDKREHLRRAKELLATEQPTDLFYAALELRFCLEAMTYEKLRTFEKYLPPSALEKWQPPQLLKAMTQFDSGADKSSKIYIGRETTPGMPVDPANMHFVGEHMAFSQTWLNKHYNKLGSLLHLQRNDKPVDETKVRGDLEAISAEVERAQTGSIRGSWMGELAHFECQLCKFQIHASHDYIRKTGRSACLNPECQADYLAKIDGKKAEFVLDGAECNCTGCGETMLIEIRHIRPGQTFKCASCNRLHKIRWGLVSSEDAGEKGEQRNE